MKPFLIIKLEKVVQAAPSGGTIGRRSVDCYVKHNIANPQVTLARMFTCSAAGVKPIDGVVFILMQIVGTFLAAPVFRTVRRARFL